VSRPTRASEAGRAYLDLQNRARAERRGTQELLTLYVVERWLARLSASSHAHKFVVKGGMLLAAYDARRPTADLDALARSVAHDQDAIVLVVSEIARLPLDDGVHYETTTATSRIIRDQAIYSGVRVAMDSTIATATVKFRLDVNFGDPVTPAPGLVTLQSLRPGMEPVRVLGYPVETVLAEKIATAIRSGRPTPASATTPTSTRLLASTRSTTLAPPLVSYDRCGRRLYRVKGRRRAEALGYGRGSCRAETGH